jgi:hypothetical protein
MNSNHSADAVGHGRRVVEKGSSGDVNYYMGDDLERWMLEVVVD